MTLLLLLACGRDKAPDTTAETGDGAEEPAWVALPAACEAPEALPADPLTLEGSARVGQEGGSGFMEALDVELVDQTAYVVGQGGLLIFDLSDTAAPERLYGPWESGRGKLHKVEPLAPGYLATSQRDEGVYIWEVAAPERAAVVGEIAGAGMEGLWHEDGLLFVTVREEGLRVYDVSDPSAPALVASAAGLAAPWELAASGDGWLYAADNTLGVVPIDARDPRAPVVGEPFPLDGPALHARFAGERLYVATGGDGVAVLDVSTRAAPRLLATVSTGGSAVMTDVADGRLWVADHEGVAVFDLSADQPTPVQREQTEQFALAVDAEGARGFVGDWNLLEVWALAEGEAGALDSPGDTLRWSEGVAETTLTNRGSGALTLVGATVEAEGATVEVGALVLPPGASTTLRVSGIGEDTTLCLASDDPDEPLRTLALRAAAAPPAGEPAPDFALADLDGRTHRLSEQLGHPVLLAYFATW